MDVIHQRCPPPAKATRAPQRVEDVPMPVRIAVSVAIMAMAGCASTPLHFHTLVSTPVPPESTAPAVARSPNITWVAVSVPASADRSELVVRQTDGQVQVAEGERWVAPLADELRTAAALELQHQFYRRTTA